MNNELIKEKVINARGCVITFQIWTLTGITIIFQGKDGCFFEFNFSFDIFDNQQLDLLAELLCAIFKNKVVIKDETKVIDRKTKEKLDDFDTIVEILNKYRGE